MFLFCQIVTFIFEQSLNLPFTIDEISYDAFRDCINLQNIILPENLREISAWAFSNCNKLNTIVLPANIKKIQPDAFEKCVGLERIILEKIPEDYSEIARATNLDKFRELLLITDDKDTIVPYELLTSGKLQIISSDDIKEQIEYNSLDKHYKTKELRIAREISQKEEELLKIQRGHYKLIRKRPKL